MKSRATILAALLGIASMWSGAALPAGFAIIEHSAQGMGHAFAGSGAVAEDASAVWFNPAGMVRLGPELQATGHLIVPSFEFTDGGSVQAAGAGTIPLLPGASTTANGGTNAVVPNLYYVRPLNDRITFGLGVNAPFGLAIEYDTSWKGRYQAVDSDIKTVNVNPALAFKINDQVSLGVGVDIAYIDATLSNAVDFTAVCLASASEAPPAFAGAFATSCVGGPAPGQGGNDGFVNNKADDLSFGFNVGLMLQPNEDTRISLAYRSEIHHKLDGTARFSVPSTVSTIEPFNATIRSAFADDGIEAGVTLPDSFSFSGYHRVHPKVALMADATWTGWSDIPQLLIVFDNPSTAGGPATETLDWKNTWRLAFGANYYHSDRLTFRMGTAWDEAPVTSPVLRTARLPDNDRFWLSFGASYRATDKLQVDFGYSHLFIDDTPIHRTGSTGNVIIGSYKSDVNIFSAQLNYRFD